LGSSKKFSGLLIFIFLLMTNQLSTKIPGWLNAGDFFIFETTV